MSEGQWKLNTKKYRQGEGNENIKYNEKRWKKDKIEISKVKERMEILFFRITFW